MLLGDKRGDNGQVEAIVAALGWPVRRINLRWLKPFDVKKPRVHATLDHLDQETSDNFGPPWPDLIITVGRRPSMVAAWIKKQAQGRTKIALFGKPSGLMRQFDLVIATGESQMPPLDKICMIPMPLMRVDEAEIAKEAVTWRDCLARLSKPLIAILIGGPTGPYVYNRNVEERLLALGRSVRDEGGTPYFVTSRRTPARLNELLERSMPEGGKLAAWDRAGDNPYKGLLGLADGFVVTGDSISMMVEIARLKKPLKIFSLPLSGLARIDQVRRAAAVRVYAHDLHNHPHAVWRKRLARLLYALNILDHTRDFEAFHRSLIERGIASSFDGPFLEPETAVEDGARLAARRIAQMMAVETA